MRAVVLLLVSLSAAAVGAQYRTLNDRYEAPRFASLPAWNARAAYLREHILWSAGLLPMPHREPLKPVVSGDIHHDGYIVSKVRFESAPDFYVTGNLYRPVGAGPFPAILSAHGHWTNGRLEDTEINSGPGRAINLARQGFVVFSHDMIGYADSRQLTHTFGSPRQGLWGLSLGGLQLWNSIRALDFLETLPYVRKDGFGATGESGGGTQTFLLAAIDSRVTVAAPVNMISFTMQGGCVCENLPGLRLDTNNVEIAATIAPRPLLMVSATGDWTAETLEKEYPAVRSIYALFGAEANVHAVRIDAPHNYNKASREAVYAWMARWLLKAPSDVMVTEKPFTADPLNDLLVFPPGGRLPTSAATADEVSERWIASAKAQSTDLANAAQLRAGLRHALGFGELPDPPGSARWTLMRPRAAVLASASRELEPALRAAGLDVRHVTVAPREGDRAGIRHFDTYNRSDAGARVAAIVETMRATPGAVLVADGDFGPAAILAAAIVPIARAIVDIDRFDLSDDGAFLARAQIAGLRRAGDFRTAAGMVSGEIVVHNAGDRFVVPTLTVTGRRLTAQEIAARASAQRGGRGR